MDWFWLCLVLVIGLFTAAFMMWRLTPRRNRQRDAMSRGRIVWLLLGGLEVMLWGCVGAWALWHDGKPPSDFLLRFGPFFIIAWGAAEIAIALRGAFAKKRA